jgi:2-hydroxy-3-keto-5-methylthiopentenyl-1-phosphate phosphatase
MLLDRSKYVRKEEYDKLAERLEQSISYSSYLAEQLNSLIKSFEKLTPSLIRKSKIEEIFNNE